MKDRKFLEQVAENLNNEGLNSSVVNVTKVNHDCLGIQCEVFEGFSAIVYTDHLEKKPAAWKRELQLLRISLSRKERKKFPLKDATTFSDLLSKSIKDVRPCVINKSMNEGIAETTVGFDFLDLWVFYFIPLKMDDTVGWIKISKSHLEYLQNEGVISSAKELHEIAIRNLKERCRYIDGYLPMLNVLTNEDAFYGASEMLNTEKLQEIADKWKADVLIIPSSVHEVIVMPVNSSLDMGFVQDMIEEVNRSEVVREDEVLSNHPYLFKRTEGIVVSA